MPRTRLLKISRLIARAIQMSMLAGVTLVVAIAPSLAQNAFDRGTPAESKGGMAGLTSYAPDKVETVNLANGNLSMSFPLVTVGGRGSASYTVALAYNSKVWSPEHNVEVITDPLGGSQTFHHYSAAFGDNTGRTPNLLVLGSGWSILKAPAIKVVRVGIDNEPNTCHPPSQEPRFQYLLTKMWVVLPDGSEVEMRDDVTDGAPLNGTVVCPVQVDGYRGRVWHSTDGSAITYISDADNGVVNMQLGGWILTPDGTRYKIAGGTSGRCNKIIDRNGNVLDITYNDPVNGATYTDQLGRDVSVQQTFSGGQLGATVTIKGYDGLPDRAFSITTGQIAALQQGNPVNLRSDFWDWDRPFLSGDYSLHTGSHVFSGQHTDLFWFTDPSTQQEVGSDIYRMQSTDDQVAVTKLTLLDGRSFRFRYNPYGEVAEIIYPGGAVSKIDYAPYGSQLCETHLLGPVSNRGVIARRQLSDGVTEDAVWNYTDDGFSQGGQFFPGRKVEVRQKPSDELLMSESHFFLALNVEYGGCSLDDSATGTGYQHYKSGKTFRIERRAGTGTETQVETRDWAQREDVDWSGTPYVNTHGQEQPPNDPRVKVEKTILENGKLAQIKYEYDRFNNVIQIKQYDFGVNPNPGPLVRQTDRVYLVDQTVNNYCYSGLDGLSSSCSTPVIPDIDEIIHVRRLLKSETITNGSGQVEAHTAYEYDNYTDEGPNGNHAPVKINSAMIKYNGSRFDAFAEMFQPRGNVTSVKALISGPIDPDTGVWATSFSQYDQAGNIVKTKDPLGRATTISYQDNFGDGSNPDFGTTKSTFAFATSASNALGHEAKTQYNYSRGVPTGVKDPNGTVTKTEYNDPYDRPTIVTAAFGSPEAANTEMSYQTPNPSSGVDPSHNKTTVSKQLDATRWLAHKTTYDGYGRPLTANQAEDGNKASSASFTIFNRQVYDGLGRVKFATNPYRTSGEASNGWTRTQYDLAGRVIDVATFDGSPNTLPPEFPATSKPGLTWTGHVETTYAGEATTVIDQAGKQRRSIADGLGRLIRADEPNGSGNIGTVVVPTQPTSYTYDARGNLKTVTQGVQTRSFGYDLLSRLTSATSPESLTTNYTYYSNGNLHTKTDARNTVITYVYDDLDRITSRDYSGPAPGGSTPDVTYAYDSPSVSNSKGRLVSISSSVSTYSYNSYDALGRVLTCSQTTALRTYSMSYQYNLAGATTSETYPGQDGSGNGRVVETQYDGAGRVAGVKKDATNYYAGGAPSDTVNRIRYTAHGAARVTKLGNGKWEHTNFNGRLQPVEIGLGINDGDSTTLRLDYGYGPITQNNGNVMSQQIVIGSSFPLDVRQSYTYDELNRLKTASEAPSGGGPQTWQQSYDYDRWGNRAVNPGSMTIPDPTLTLQSLTDFNTSNRIQKAGFGYDSAGNLTKDPTTAADAMVYDGENKLVSYTKAGMTTEYSYDGDGHRVKKVDRPGSPSEVTTVFVYNAASQLLAEYSNSTATPPGGGGTSYLTTDHLGSTRVVTKQDGSVKARYDYLPFGEELSLGIAGRSVPMGYSGADGTRQKFTRKERDTESGFDYFFARYYSASQARFTAIDPSSESINPSDPQTFNRYSYSLNNPLRYVDPDGEIPVETAIDVLSFAESFYQLWNNPSWAALGYLIWDGISIAVPYAPGSWVAKVGKYGYKGFKAVGIGKKGLDAFETIVNNDYVRRGVGLMAQGDDAVKGYLGLKAADRAADFLGVAQNGKYVIGEAKGSNVASAVEQIQKTVDGLLKMDSNAKVKTTEIVVRLGQRIEGGYKVMKGVLYKYNNATQELERVTVQVGKKAKAVTVRSIDTGEHIEEYYRNGPTHY